jgi:hypothetical protein
MIRVVPLLALAASSALLPATSHRPVAAKPNVVVIHAKDFAFTVPKSVPAGTTTFRLVNDGKQFHHLSIIQLAKGKSYMDYLASLKAGGPPPSWATDVGGANAAAPGRSVSATLTLGAGIYVIACWIPSPGEQTPHAMKGMMSALSVVPAVIQAGAPAAEAAAAPTPDLQLELSDYAFKFSKPLTAGHHVIHVMNSAAQSHEVLFLRLAPGKTVKDFATWAEEGKMKGPPPAQPINGMSALGTGRTGTFEADIKPGNYGLLCFVPDAKDGKPHLMHGMAMDVTVK